MGLGGIGQTVAKRLKGFNVESILYCGNREKPEGILNTNIMKHYKTSIVFNYYFLFTGLALGAIFVSFEELLRQSDFIVISCLLNESTTKMINAAAFDRMKKTAILVNVSRGGMILYT